MLNPLFEPQGAEERDSTLSVVAIPALGLSRPLEWVDSSGALWLQTLLNDAVPQAQVWEYVYDTNIRGSLAQRLSSEATNLAEALHSHCADAQRGKLPLVFVCHGTGGLVLKAALCICRDRHYLYRTVIDVVAGAIFLGAPHFSGNKQQAKRTFDLLLKCQHKGIGRSLSTDLDVEWLTETCKKFELINLKVPIVSAYETKETSTQHNLFSKFRSKGKGQVIVPKSMCELRTTTEKVVDSSAGHFDICRVSVGSDVYRESKILFRDVMNIAPERIADASKPYTIPPGLVDISLRSPSTAGYTKLEERISVPVSIPLGGATGGSTIGSFEMVPQAAAMEITSKDPTLPCFSLGTHRRMDQFCGRQDMMKIIDDNLLLPSSRPSSKGKGQKVDPPMTDNGLSLRSFAICGLGGMGKTELAVEYAYSRRDEFDAVFWLGADDANILASNFAQIPRQLGLEDDILDFAASRDVAMGWLSQPLKKTSEADEPDNIASWLLIFDNVDNLDVLDDHWPKFGRGSVLVTSRDPFAKHTRYVQRGINLPPLSHVESEALMQRLTLVKADVGQKDALSGIAQKFGGLPLAINQMSGVFRRLRLSYTEFFSYYDEEGMEKLVEKHTDRTDPQRIRSLATVWSLDRLSKGTKALLQVISLLDPDDIPEELLIDRARKVKLEGYPKTRGDYYDARSELVSSSLVNQAAEKERLFLHRLIQDTTKSMMSEEELVAAFQAAATLIISTWPFQSMKEHHSVARFSKCEAIFPSVLRLKNGLENLLESSTDFPLNIGLARLFNDTGWYMFERGLIEETKPFCEFALLIGKQLQPQLGEEAAEAIRESHSFLGIALTETNEHSLSMTHKQKWLDILEERTSESGDKVEDYELGYAYNEIGVAYGNNDMLDEAAVAFSRSIEIFQGLDDYEDTMLGWPEPNLGFIYWMQGNLEQAEKALVEILDIHAAAWGVDDTNSFKTGKILYAMGNVLEAQGRFDESLGFHKRCFEQYKKVLGLNHHRVGDICYRMAGHCIRLQLHSEAEAYLDSALKIFNSRSYLANELARTTFRKGTLSRMMGLEEKADKLLNEAYKIRKGVRPRDSRPLDQLRESDFDALVAFWSR